MAVTASVILTAQVKAEQMWKDSRLAAEYETHADAAVAVKKNQTVRMTELTDPDTDKDLKVMWIDPCTNQVEDCTATCDITGPMAATAGQLYSLDICKEITFSASSELARRNEYTEEEFLANKTLLAKKALDEYWAQQVLLQLKAFSGIYVFPENYTYANGTTTIPFANYNVALLPYLTRAAIMNKMTGNYIIDDGALWNSVYNAGLYEGNLDGKGLAKAASELSRKLTFDLWNFPQAGITEDTFIVGSGAVAFATKARFSRTPVYVDGKVQQWRWSEPSNTIPGVVYDFYSQKTCVTTGTGSGVQEDVVDNVKVKTRGGIFLNPKGCPVTVGGTTYTPSGVMSLSVGS